MKVKKTSIVYWQSAHMAHKKIINARYWNVRALFPLHVHTETTKNNKMPGEEKLAGHLAGRNNLVPSFCLGEGKKVHAESPEKRKIDENLVNLQCWSPPPQETKSVGSRFFLLLCRLFLRSEAGTEQLLTALHRSLAHRLSDLRPKPNWTVKGKNKSIAISKTREKGKETSCLG